MSLNINELWDYGDPELSEQRFLAALDAADPDQRKILQTQIARTHGLRRDFDKARDILSGLEPGIGAASTEARVRYSLELGRTHASTMHPPEAKNLDAARRCFDEAYALASAARLDGLAIDALHMMACVDADPERQLEWNAKAIAYLERSDQPEAKVWEGSLRNNTGSALSLKGDHDAALTQFRLSRAAHERAGRMHKVRIADWMIARTYRGQEKYADALAMQLALERAWDADRQPDPDVYEELELLYTALDDPARAQYY